MVNIKKAKKGTIKHPRNNTFPKHFFLKDSHLLKNTASSVKPLNATSLTFRHHHFPCGELYQEKVTGHKKPF